MRFSTRLEMLQKPANFIDAVQIMMVVADIKKEVID
jgi:hypothetical protein